MLEEVKVCRFGRVEAKSDNWISILVVVQELLLKSNRFSFFCLRKERNT